MSRDAPARKSPSGSPPTPTPSMRPFLYMMLPMMLWFILLPFADIIAAPLKPLLNPLAAVSFQGTVTLLAVISGVLSVLLRFRFTNWRKAQEMQQKSARIGKQLREAMKSQNKHQIQKARQEQMAMMRENQEMMAEQFKPTLLLLVVSMPFFMWAWTSVGPPFSGVVATAALMEGCPSDVTLGEFPNTTRNLSTCGRVTPEVNATLAYVATHCPYRAGSGPFSDHVRGCIPGSIRVPPIFGPKDTGFREATQLALGFMPWWIVWYFICSMPASHLLQRWMEDRMRRKERDAALAVPGGGG